MVTYKEREGIISRGINYVKSYFNVYSLLIFGAGATAGFVIGSTGKLAVDFVDFLYRSSDYIISNFPNYNIPSSLEYAIDRFSTALPSAIAEGSRAAPVYGAGTVIFSKLFKRLFSSLLRRK
jgi:hypothetical protein